MKTFWSTVYMTFHHTFLNSSNRLKNGQVIHFLVQSIIIVDLAAGIDIQFQLCWSILGKVAKFSGTKIGLTLYKTKKVLSQARRNFSYSYKLLSKWIITPASTFSNAIFICRCFSWPLEYCANVTTVRLTDVALGTNFFVLLRPRKRGKINKNLSS